MPLSYGGRVIGVLMVIASQQGRLFNSDDVYLLELLASQAAVAIAHSQLFADQRALMGEVDLARSQLETVLTSTENPVVAVDRHLRLIFANPAATALFPLIDVGANLTDILPDHALPPSYRQALADLRRNRSHIYEISYEGKSYLCHLACLGRPRVTGWVAILNDVTQFKELDRVKSEMVRMTSHDLKNPLQAAMANLELLSDDLADLQDEEIHLSLAAIDKQLMRMNRIIAGILDLERVKSGIPTFELCHVRPIIENTVEELQELARNKTISIEVEVDDDLPEFLGDTGQFERALINLVENAIKFTPVGGCVTIQAKQTSEGLAFGVIDTGIGIPAELHDRIFDRFFRGRQAGADHVSGSGLGLSLVKAVVENHHGRIWFESEPQKGTAFFILIPAAPMEQILS